VRLAWILLGVALIAVAAGCGGQPGEFDGAGDVGGSVTYLACSKATPPVCRRAPIPYRASGSVDAAVLGRQLDGNGRTGSGIVHGHFGDNYVSPGRYRYSIPPLEREGCRPRPTFEIKRQRYYEIRFRFATPGQCSATVWERPYGTNHQAGTVVARATG
jgi:hypothetical protein